MDRILKGIMRYRQTDKKTMVQQFKQVKNRPEVRNQIWNSVCLHFDTRVTSRDLHS